MSCKSLSLTALHILLELSLWDALIIPTREPFAVLGLS